MSGHQRTTRPPPKKQNLRPTQPNESRSLGKLKGQLSPYPPRPSQPPPDAPLQHKPREPVAGEWQATPSRGFDPEPFREALLQKNGVWSNRRSALEDMSKPEEEPSEIPEESEFVEMTFLPGTLVDIRR